MAQTKFVKKVGKRRLELKSFEDELALAGMMQFKLRNWHTGAYVLMQGEDQYKFIFGFECKGVHSYLPSEQVDKIFDNLEAGLKDLPYGERITFHLGAFSSDSSRQEQLAKLIENAPSDELRFLLWGERSRIQELARRGLREPKFLRVYVSYTIGQKTQDASDMIEKLLARGVDFWHQFKGTTKSFQQSRFKEIATKAFTDGFVRWLQLLTNKMGLEARPLTEVVLWETLWKRFHPTEPIPIPQLLILDADGLREEVTCEVHPSSLLQTQNPPVADRRWVHVNEHYVAPLTFLAKPGGWSNKLSQLRWLWEIIARDEIVNTEIFCQLTPANQSLVRTDAQRLMKQSNVVALSANKKQSIDVAAQIKVKRSVAAQERMIEGESALYTSVIILVHRKTVDELASAAAYLEDCFRRPAWVVWEKEYAWKLWLDTLPVVWNQQLVKPFDRRQLYLTSEVLGLTPLVCTRTFDNEGLELLGEDGGTPIFLDLFTQHKNLGIFATTRAGKSVLVSGILTQAMARGWPIVALDFPKEDGSSTFSDYTKFMGSRGAYFDITTQSSNLFEIPDLRRMSPQKRQERLEDYKDFLRSALLTMTVAKSTDQLLNQTIGAIYTLALNAFFEDEQVYERYNKAIESGFGSDEWQQVPTLKDFLPFCTAERLQLDEAIDVHSNTHRGLQQIQLSLKSWLKSRVGRAISSPSSFPTDAQLLVFALRNLSNDDDAAVMALAAYSAAKRRTLEYPDSILFLDEGPILFQYSDVARMIGRQCANGAKSGVRVILTGQDPNTIANSVAGAQILQNLSARLIGRIEPTAIKSFEGIFDYSREMIANNATEAFFPKREGIYSRWLLDTKGFYTVCRYYPSFIGLAVVVNNPAEQSARTWFLKHYPDKYYALSRFAEYLVQWIREGRKPFPIPEVDNEVDLPLAS